MLYYYCIPTTTFLFFILLLLSNTPFPSAILAGGFFFGKTAIFPYDKYMLFYLKKIDKVWGGTRIKDGKEKNNGEDKTAYFQNLQLLEL